MKKIKFIFLLLLCYQFATAQYSVNGNATQTSCNCYTLTPDLATKSGTVWNNNQIDLNQSFEFTFKVFLGCSDVNGADGIAFVLQPISTSVGGTGSGMGYAGISPAIAVTLDTYQNTDVANDPSYDHIAIQLNGDVNHANANTITPLTPISAFSDNVEDCQDHYLTVIWDALLKNMIVYFDNQERLNVEFDFVTNVLGGNSMVYWGFTGATGALHNLQKFCTPLTPAFYFSSTQKRCANTPITFYDSTVSFNGIVLKRYWNFGDGSPIDSININPVHTYSSAGSYNVTYTVVGLDGCEQMYPQTLVIADKPLAGFSITGNCNDFGIQFTDTSHVNFGTINQWFWNLDNAGQTSTDPNPFSLYTLSGPKNIKFVVTTLEGCVSDTLYKTIEVGVNANAVLTPLSAVCENAPSFALTGGSPVSFIALGTGMYSGNGVNVSNGFFNPQIAGIGTHAITYTFTTISGCISSASQSITVNPVPSDANAGPSVSISAGVGTYLQGSGTGTTYLWNPTIGLTGANSLTPFANPNQTTTYTLTVQNDFGCSSTDSMILTVNQPCFNPAKIFTPNNDGYNDKWIVFDASCIHHVEATVYNRYGSLVYYSKDYQNNWEGTHNSMPLPDATYYYILNVVDKNGTRFTRKGDVTVIR